MWKSIGKFVGVPAAALAGTFAAGSWVKAIESQAAKNAENIVKIETSQKVMDQRVWQMLLGQLAIQGRLGVTQKDLEKMAEKAKEMDNPAFKAPKQTKGENNG